VEKISKYYIEGGNKMRKKLLVGTLVAGLIMGGAVAAGASDDSNHKDDKSTRSSEVTHNSHVEIETEHGRTFYKSKNDDNPHKSASSKSSNSRVLSKSAAAKIALKAVKGKITKIEKEVEHGRIVYKFEIRNSSGKHKVRIDAKTGKIVRIKHDK
jgi:uncharacterized membrane protein YkoI